MTTIIQATEERPQAGQTRRSLGAFIAAGGFRIVYDTCCGAGTFLVAGFALSADIRAESVGIISSSVSAACLMQLVALSIVTRMGNRKRFALFAATCEPLLLSAGVLLVLVAPVPLRLPVLATMAALAAGALHLSKPVMDDWTASAVPSPLRGRFFGRNIQVQCIVAVLAMLVVGRIGDAIGKTNTAGFAAVLLAGAAFGLLSVLAMSRAAMPSMAADSDVGPADVLRVWKHRPFRHFVLGIVLYNLPFYVAIPYYQVFNLSVLGMSKTTIAVMLAGYWVLKILASPWWGKRVARIGPRRFVLCAGPFYAAFLFGVALSGPGRTWPIYLAWAMAGLLDGGFAVNLGVALYSAVPEEGARPAFFASFSLVTTLAAMLGPMLAVAMLKVLNGMTFQFAGIPMGRFNVMYGLCGLAMCLTTFAGLVLDGRTRSPEEATVEAQSEPVA